ncbi:hypothetical protein H9P43_007550 [Blastocladiella emersonii ATCC 22665]|nr:hypothetical protein H9P43_007550 [Blastocladiella emersonii ATCC 22665]
MAEPISSQILPPLVVRGLSDKLYDKRKVAALEIEKIVRDTVAQHPEGYQPTVSTLIKFLSDEFITTSVSNLRNGGLIGLAAISIALGPDLIPHFIGMIVSPVLACFQDMDSRVRYYACESLYNIAKVARHHILASFPQIFDVLSKLFADTDLSVKSGAELLDRLLKDIITEQKSTHVTTFTLFNLDEFISLLEERIHTLNPFTRSFLVAWLAVLDSVPGVELVSSIHIFLPGLFKFLTDDNEDVRVATSNLLAELLREISEAVDVQRRLGIGFGALERSIYGDSLDRVDLGAREGEAGNWIPAQNVHLDFPRMFTLLLPFLDASSAGGTAAGGGGGGTTAATSAAASLEVRVTCLQWINEFILLARQIMLPFASEILRPVLPAIAAMDQGIQSTAATTNSLLFTLIAESDLAQQTEMTRLDLGQVLQTVLALCTNVAEETRMGCLEWLLMLHKKAPPFVLAFPNLLPTVFTLLSDPSEDVVKRALQLVAQVSSFSEGAQFDVLMADILLLFCRDRKLLEARGSLIVRQLCLALSPEDVFRSFSQVLEREEDVEFASTMITNLNLILITSAELSDMRRRLRAFEKDGQQLFADLYRSWAHSAVATFSLCLLAQAYEHGFNLLQIFEDLEITVNLLVQIDKLVQLLESPVFSYLRLQLLEPDRYPYLFKCLYGLLMLLPQSSAFATLRNRLTCVSTLGYMHVVPRTAPEPAPSKFLLKRSNGAEVKWADLLTHFKNVQIGHERARKALLTASRFGSQRRSRNAGSAGKAFLGSGGGGSTGLLAALAAGTGGGGGNTGGAVGGMMGNNNASGSGSGGSLNQLGLGGFGGLAPGAVVTGIPMSPTMASGGGGASGAVSPTGLGLSQIRSPEIRTKKRFVAAARRVASGIPTPSTGGPAQPAAAGAGAGAAQQASSGKK